MRMRWPLRSTRSKVPRWRRSSPLSVKAGEWMAPGADRAARLAQQDVERLPGALAVEDVARPQREFVAELAHQLFVDPLKLDAVDDAFVDRHRERAGRGVELGVHARERVALVAVVALDRLGDVVGRVGERLAGLHADRSRMACSASSFAPVITIERTIGALGCATGGTSCASRPWARSDTATRQRGQATPSLEVLSRA